MIIREDGIIEITPEELKHKEELAWSTGLFEGEGSIGYYGRSFLLRVSQNGNHSNNLLGRFNNAFNNLGHITKLTELTKSGEEECGLHFCNINDCCYVTDGMWPYLTPDSEKIKQIINAYVKFNSRKLKQARSSSVQVSLPGEDFIRIRDDNNIEHRRYFNDAPLQ